MDTIDITLYLVGKDEEEARDNFPFATYDSAEQYTLDYPEDDLKVFSVTAWIDFSTVESA